MIARLLAWLLVPGVAVAGESPLEEVAHSIRSVVRSPRPEAGALDAAVQRLWEVVPTLDAPVEDAAWVSLLLDLTLARYQLGRPWQAPRVAAAWSRPDLRLTVGPSLTDLAGWHPPDLPDAEPLPHGRTVWLDGRQRTGLPDLQGLHLVQGTRCGAWSSVLGEGEAATQVRALWYADCPAPDWTARDKGLIAGGAAMVVLGIAAVATSFVLSEQTTEGPVPLLLGEPVSAASRQALVGANAAGWTVAALGVGVVVQGAVWRSRDVRRARAQP